MSLLPEPADLTDTDLTETLPAAAPAEPDAAPATGSLSPSPITETGPPVVPGASEAARPAPSVTRLAVGIVAGAAVAALGGWILGEYPFTGIMPYITGVLFALVVAEVILSISRREPNRAIAATSAVITAAGIGLAVWIQSTEGLVAIPPGGWVAIVLGFLVALLRGGIRAGGRPKASSQPSP